METVKRSASLLGAWGKGRGMERWSTEHVQGSETIPYDTVMVDTWHYAFVRTHKVYIVNSEP